MPLAEPEPFIDKVEKLRAHFELEEELIANAVISAAVERLELAAQVEGQNIREQADTCLAIMQVLHTELGECTAAVAQICDGAASWLLLCWCQVTPSIVHPLS